MARGERQERREPKSPEPEEAEQQTPEQETEDQPAPEVEETPEVVSANVNQNMWGTLGVYDPTESRTTRVNAVIYGAPGSGKTRLAATAPRPIILDLEHGAPATVKALGRKGVSIIDVHNVPERDPDGNPTGRMLTPLTVVRTVYAELRRGNHDFETVVIDPISELQKMLMEEVVKRYPSSKRQYGDIPMMADWQKSLGDATKLVTAFRALPIRTVIIAHAEIPQHPDDMVSPLVSGKNFKPFLQGAMDLLGYLSVEEDGDKTVRKLQVDSTPTVIAKNRGGKLPPVIYDPDLTDIFRRMEE